MAKVYLKIKAGAGDCFSYDGEYCYFGRKAKGECKKTYWDEKYPCRSKHAYIQVPAPEVHE